MKDRAYHFEIQDLITQFVAAFDDVVIGRHNKDREEMAQVKVRYVYAPKERVLYDIINKAQNLTLPVISVSLGGVERDETRVFNKLYGFDVPGRRYDDDPVKLTSHVGMPVPININVNMSIIAAYQADMDQILSNFVPYNNPYVILSWQVPEAFNLLLLQEIRSEVMWSGSVSMKYPTDTTGTDKFRMEADTAFVIKGWLFPAAPKDPIKNIFFIDSNFYATRILNSDRFRGYDTYTDLGTLQYKLSSMNDAELDTITVSAAPTVSNIYYDGGVEYRPVMETLIIPTDVTPGKFLINGKRFQYTSHVMLSSNDSVFSPNMTAIEFDHYPTVNGVIVPLSCYQIINENTMTLTLPTNLMGGKMDVIIVDAAGWDSFYSHDVLIDLM